MHVRALEESLRHSGHGLSAPPVYDDMVVQINFAAKMRVTGGNMDEVRTLQSLTVFSLGHMNIYIHTLQTIFESHAKVQWQVNKRSLGIHSFF